MDKTVGYCSKTTGKFRTGWFLVYETLLYDDFSTPRSHKGH